jgi:hypothetical protein
MTRRRNDRTRVRWLPIYTERIITGLVWRLPRLVAYWAAVRVITEASASERWRETSLDDIPASAALTEWLKRRRP